MEKERFTRFLTKVAREPDDFGKIFIHFVLAHAHEDEQMFWLISGLSDSAKELERRGDIRDAEK